MDLTDDLMGGASPYIANLVYDIDVRLLFIELMDDPKKQNPVRRIVFPEVLLYSESNPEKELDDESLDDLMSINRAGEGRVMIRTFKKEITLELAADPFWERID